MAVAVATTVMWLLILLVARLGGRGSGGFVHDTVTRFMGLIVIAMGVQFALSGVRSFMLEPYRAALRHDVTDSELVSWELARGVRGYLTGKGFGPFTVESEGGVAERSRLWFEPMQITRQ